MEVGERKISFNMYKAMRHPHEDYSLLSVYVIDIPVDSVRKEHELALHSNDKSLPLAPTSSLPITSGDVYSLISFLVDYLFSVNSALPLMHNPLFGMISTNMSLLSDTTSSKEGCFSNSTGTKCVHEAKFQLQNHGKSSKGIILTPIDSSLSTSLIVPPSDVVKWALHSHSTPIAPSRPKISSHALSYLKDLIISCHESMRNGGKPEAFTAINQLSVDLMPKTTHKYVKDAHFEVVAI